MSESFYHASAEEQFGVIDHTLHRYITDEKPTAQQLEQHYTAMKDSPHPVVQAAAGWAMAAIGMTRQKDVGIAQRTEALQQASGQWQKASRTTREVLRHVPSHHTDTIAAHQELGVRLIFAEVCLPTMRAVSERYALGKTRLELLAETQEAQLRLAETVLRQDLQNPANSHFHRLAHDLLLSALLHRDNIHPEFLATPTSLRQAYHSKQRLRAGLLVRDFSKPRRPYRAPLVADPLAPPCEPGKMDTALHIQADRDLVLPGENSALSTLQRLIWEREAAVSTKITAKFTEMSHWLVQQVVTYRNIRELRVPKSDSG